VEDKWQIADDDAERALPLGVYPVLICYDPHEGFIPNGASWNGKEWSNRAVAYFMRQPCESEKQATHIAYENDPNW